MIAAIYARKSNEQTGVADDMKSVDIQIAACRQCAERHGWDVAPAHIYVDDGISGADFVDRAGFSKLMNALRPRPAFDVLIMTEVSRLGREQIKTSGALQQITGAGVIVWMAHEDRECRLDSAIDKAMLTFQTFGAELEREKASTRTHGAMTQKFFAGHVCGGRCFGYRNVDVLSDVPDVHGRRKRLYVRREVNEEEAIVVRRIFDMCAARRGLKTIARTLNDEGAACPKSTRGRPPGWSPSSVREALYRRDYKGEIVWNKNEKTYRADGRKHQKPRPESEWKTRRDESLRIVSDQQWHAAHDRLSRIREYALRLRGGKLAAGPPPVEFNQGGRTPATRVPFLLTGLSTCTCGAGLEGFRRDWKNAVHCYFCSANRRKGSSICPNRMILPMDAADLEVLKAVDYCVFRPDVIKAVIDRTLAQIEADRSGDRLEKLESELQDVVSALARLASAIAVGGNIPEIAAEARKHHQRREALEVEIAGLRARTKGLDPAGLRRRMTERLTDWRGLLQRNREQGRQVLQRVLLDRFVFEPQADGSCKFTAPGTLARLIHGSTETRGKAPDTRVWWTRPGSNR